MKLCKILVLSADKKSISELCSGGKILADDIIAVVYGDENAEVAARYSAKEIIKCSEKNNVLFEEYAHKIAEYAQENNVKAVLTTSSVEDRLLAGKIAAYLDSYVLSNVSEIRDDGNLTTLRTVYGGTAVREEKPTVKIPVITIGSGVFPVEDIAEADSVNVVEEFVIDQPKIKLIDKREKTEAAVNLKTARCIVDMGRGFAKEEDLDLGKKLAGVIGADIGCSRPVAESNGWLPRARYIGVTGVVVKPELIITLGVSGQIQHLVGINNSKSIVAINKDKNASIFKNCDFGIVGDMYKILPVLINKLS